MEVHVEFRHKSFLFLKKSNQNAGGYTCLVKNIIITDPNSFKIEVFGEHQGTETHRSVVGVSIRNQTHIQKFPRGFGKTFPNLKYFEIDNSSITMLYKEDFLDLGHLQGLWMQRNPIVALKDDLFTNVQGLRFVCFRKNKLKYIGQDILEPLKNVEHVNFSENTTIDMQYDNDGPEKLSALNREISEKCRFPSKTAPADSSALENRVECLEAKVRKLEYDNQMLGAKLTQLSGLSQMLEILQSRVEVVENINNF